MLSFFSHNHLPCRQWISRLFFNIQRLSKYSIALSGIAAACVWLGCQGCSTEVDLTAPPKDIWVVYGTLVEGDTVQYVRVSRGFLVEEDALAFAKENDLSAKDLELQLEGNGRTLVAQEVDSVPKVPEDGLFYPFTTLYRFDTKGADALSLGADYTLTVRARRDEGAFLTSRTQIPEQPRFTFPRQFYRPVGTQRCLEPLALEADLPVVFTPGTIAPAAAYELSASMIYTENGVSKLATFGPTPMFSTNRGCSRAGGLCYELIAGDVLRAWVADINRQPQNVYRYDVTDANACNQEISFLPQVCQLTLTAMDENIMKFRRAGDPSFVDFNSVRQSFTNITSEQDMIPLGIFGGLARQQVSFRLSECSEFLLGLNGTPEPMDPCSF